MSKFNAIDTAEKVADQAKSVAYLKTVEALSRPGVLHDGDSYDLTIEIHLRWKYIDGELVPQPLPEARVIL